MSLYAEPRLVADVSNCFFYHAITLPGIGVVTGSWNLHDLDAYLGQFEFHNSTTPIGSGTASCSREPGSLTAALTPFRPRSTQST